jgi:hypothetical protein
MYTTSDSSTFYRKALSHVPYVVLSSETKKKFPVYSYHLRINDLIQFDYSPSTNVTDVSLNSKEILDHIKVEPETLYHPCKYTTIDSVEFIAHYEKRKLEDPNAIIQALDKVRFEYTPDKNFCNCFSYETYECNDPSAHSHFSLAINGKLSPLQKAFIRNTYREILEKNPSSPYFIKSNPTFPYSLA